LPQLLGGFAAYLRMPEIKTLKGRRGFYARLFKPLNPEYAL
jgi:hypothetical protein